jgi:hypothetical protein
LIALSVASLAFAVWQHRRMRRKVRQEAGDDADF